MILGFSFVLLKLLVFSAVSLIRATLTISGDLVSPNSLSLLCFRICGFGSYSVSLTAMAAAADVDAEMQQQLTNEVKLFNRWTYDDVSVISSAFILLILFFVFVLTLCLSLFDSLASVRFNHFLSEFSISYLVDASSLLDVMGISIISLLLA